MSVTREVKRTSLLIAKSPDNHANPTVKRKTMSRALIVPDNQREAPLDLGGFEITVLASEDDTGDYEVFYIAGPEGKGPGPHYHPWHESFFVLQGTLHCGVDNTETIA